MVPDPAGERTEVDPFRTALDAMLDSVAIDRAVRDEHGRLVDFQIEYLNPVAIDVVGRSAEELVGRRMLEAYPDLAGTDLFAAYCSVVETGVPVALDSHPYRAVVDGQEVTAWYHVRAVRLGDGIMIVTRDVTADRTATAALEDAVRELEAAQALAHIGTWTYDVATGTFSWSDELYRIFGIDPSTPSDVLTQAYRDIVDPHDRRTMKALIRAAAVDGKPFFTEHTLHLATGETAHTIVLGDVVRDPTGRIIRVWGTMQDVTESTRTEYALEATATELERELATIDALQRAILPDLPDIGDLDIAACYLPAGSQARVGGDWYDVFELADGLVAFVVGDVAGHGLPSAALMAQLRNALRAYAISGLGVAETLDALNAFLRTFDREGYATCLYALYEPATRRLRWAHAGHLPPMMVREPDDSDPRAGAIRGTFLASGTGTPLGAVRNAVYDEREVVLDAGTCLVLYTDGLVERRGEVIDVGFDRLLGAVAEVVVERFDDFCDELSALALEGGKPSDDVCVLAVRCRPSSS